MIVEKVSRKGNQFEQRHREEGGANPDDQGDRRQQPDPSVDGEVAQN